MKKYFYILIIIVAACNHKKSEPVGAYKATASFHLPDSLTKGDTPVHFVKIFREGYWIASVYGNRFQSMYSCGGGTYDAGNGNYTGVFDYYSRDTSMINAKDVIKYAKPGNKFFETGYTKNSEVNSFIHHSSFEKISTTIPLKNNLLEGVWKIESGQVGYSRMGDEYIKIYVYPRFAWVQYNKQEKKFRAAGGGTYQFDGKFVTETLDYTTYKIAIGSTIEWKLTELAKNKIMLYDIDSYFDEEIWTRVK